MPWKAMHPVHPEKPNQTRAVSLPGRCRNHVVSANISMGLPRRALSLCLEVVCGHHVGRSTALEDVWAQHKIRTCIGRGFAVCWSPSTERPDLEL